MQVPCSVAIETNTLVKTATDHLKEATRVLLKLCSDDFKYLLSISRKGI